jgi:LuxR family maltose regulon positive regulatory protein
VNRLNNNIPQGLVLVSAPAGYGKSTLVSCWLEASEKPGTWLSLDEDDNELRQFLLVFVTAIQKIFPDAARETLALLNAPTLPSPQVLHTILTNELDLIEQDFIIVLDDIHLVQSQAVLEFLNTLLCHPPLSMQLVLIGRRDPGIGIPALRGKGLLTEIRMSDLRFSVAEVKELLSQSMVQKIDESIAVALADKAEGWVTGLRLAILAMCGQDDSGQKLLDLRGTTRYVMDYLLSELLENQSPAIQLCLLKSSVLNRFCSPLFDALREHDTAPGQDGIEGGMFLSWLIKNNLFIIPLDSDNQWFRYHHLFQEMLQRKLKQSMGDEEIEQLHIQASVWFESNGLITDSIKHALLAGDVERAANIVEEHRYIELETERWNVVVQWLNMLPNEIRQVRPKLLLTEIWICNLQHQLARAMTLLEQVEVLLRGQPTEPMERGEFAFLRGYVAYFEGQTELSRKTLEEAVSLLMGKQTPFLGEAELMLGLVRCMLGEEVQAIQALQTRIKEIDPAENYLRSRLIAGLAFIYMLCGDLVQARLEAQRLLQVAKKHDMRLAEAWSYYFIACTQLHTGDLEGAAVTFAQTVALRYMLEPMAAVDALAGLSLTQQLMQFDDDAAKTCHQLQEFALELNETEFLSMAHSHQARIALLRGDLTKAAAWAQSAKEVPAPSTIFMWLEVPSITRARVLIATETRKNLEDAIELLRTINQINEECRFTCQMIEVSVLKSLALEKLGREDDALKCLTEAVNLAGPGRWVRPFIECGQLMADFLKRLDRNEVNPDQIEQLLSAFEGAGQIDLQSSPDYSTKRIQTSSRSQCLPEPLTNRELDILELLSQRMQNKEIAEKLYISPVTVKSHLRNIYQKLSVEKRRQAVERAMDLGLIG